MGEGGGVEGANNVKPIKSGSFTLFLLSFVLLQNHFITALYFFFVYWTGHTVEHNKEQIYMTEGAMACSCHL